MKFLLNNKEDFDNWRENNTSYDCISYAEDEPKYYPCVVTYRYVDSADNLYYDDICIFKDEGNIKGTVDFYCGISGDSDELLIKDVKNQDEHFGDIDEYKLDWSNTESGNTK